MIEIAQARVEVTLRLIQSQDLSFARAGPLRS